MVIGDKDWEGNTLILGGWKANLYLTKLGTYILKTPSGSQSYNTPREALRAYNEANNTLLKEIPHIKLGESIKFESTSIPGLFYYVSVPDLICTCPGFLYRGQCKHVDFLTHLTQGEKIDA